jgi:hypothetical protein
MLYLDKILKLIYNFKHENFNFFSHNFDYIFNDEKD